MHYFPNHTIGCKLCYFCWFFSESIHNAKLSLCTNFGWNQFITFQTIPFIANNAILQQLAATWLFFEKETLLNQFIRPSYPFIPTLEVTNALYSELNHLLQIMLFCSILQQHDFFWKKRPFWINSGCQTIPVYQF